MNRIFGKSNPKPKPTLNSAISQTDERIDSYHVKIKRLEGELVALKPQMKNPAVKQKAVRILKQKKMYEQQLGQLQQQVFNMEMQNDTQENLKNTVITVDAMMTANKALKSQYKAINLEKIDKMQDEMEDLMEMANEVQETMGRSYGLPDDLDEDDLEAELDALQDEVLLEESEPSYLDSLPEASDAIPGGFNKAQEQEQPQKIGV